MKARILLAVTNDLLNDQRVMRTCSALQEAGYDVFTVGRIHSRTDLALQPPVPCVRFHIRPERGKFFYIIFNLRLFLYLLTAKADILYANDLDTLPAMWLGAVLRRKKLVYDAHEHFTEVPELTGRPFTQSLWRRAENFLAPRAHLMITVNHSLADIFSGTFRRDVVVVRNLPFRRTQTEISRVKGRLIYQGALNTGRGLELLIRAMRHLPECELILAGRGDCEAQLRKLAADLQLDKSVHFSGHVPIRELPALTATAMLGFSLEEDLGLNYRLALPNKVMDYIQDRVPVIVSDLPEMKAVTEKYGTGWVLKKEDRTEERLADMIRNILYDEARWQHAVQECGTAGAELCWEKEKGKLLDAIRSLQP